MIGLLATYVVGVVVALFWFLFGLYMYFLPMPLNTNLGADFNHDIGTSLVAQGLILFITFLFAGLVRFMQGNKEQEEIREDRRIIREMYQWMQDQRVKNESVLEVPSDRVDAIPGLPLLNGNRAEPKAETQSPN